jgi:Na+-translocating ferredoxin:NAD+ oxidoreductase subunit B
MTPITPEAIDAILPQTQCGQCGYGACKPYAQAIAGGEAINRCPPGGDETIRELAILLGREVLPLDSTCGTHKPKMLALVDEPQCIGCALCLAACPVDAIVGAAKYMHTVIAAECTGCELCLPVCPVDCIRLIPAPQLASDQKKESADRARRRYEFSQFRLARDREERAARLEKARPKSRAA